MIRKILFVFILSAAFAGAALAQANSTNTLCPVMRNEHVKKKFHTTWKDKEVYFCCRSCVKRFKKDPEKYAKNI